jgi:hypothetical protein
MIDVLTNQPLRVSNAGNPWPYIRLAEAQLADLCKVLDKNKIRYSVDENVISFDGGPEVANVSLGRSPDAHAIQEILDKAQ